MKGFILGGGSAALYASYRIGFPILMTSPEKPRHYTPRILHVKDKVGKLLNDLGLSVEKKNIKINYFYKGKEYDHATPDMVKEYYLKCYGTLPGERIGLYKPFITVFTTTLDELEKVLSSQVEIRYERITTIDLKKKILITNCSTYEYDILINTIPLPIFISLAQLNLEPFIYKSLWIYRKSSGEAEERILHYMDFSDPRTRYFSLLGNSYEERLSPIEGIEPYTFIKYGKINDKMLKNRKKL